MNRLIIKTACKAALAAVVIAATGFGQRAQAANWLQLYNTEPSGTSAPLKVWGFVQPVYSSDDGTKVEGLTGPPSVTAFNGTVPNFNLIGPSLESPRTFNLFRARIGIRGTLSPLDDKLSYFVLTEFGNNGLTHFSGDHPVISDAFVTWNASKLVRFSMGLQKVPGAWETRVGIPVLPFVNFSTLSLQNTLERFIDPKAMLTPAAGNGYHLIPSQQNITGFGAYRDVGLKAFQWFRNGPWEYAYAFMAGNGGPLDSMSTNSGLDTYGMLRTSYIFDGKGPYRNDAGVWVWFHNGSRHIDQIGSFSLKRYGVGGSWSMNQHKPGGFSVHADWMQAKGWIIAPAPFQYDAATAANYTGPALGGYDNLTQWTLYPGPDSKATGYVVQGGFYVQKNIELQLRYDVYNRMTNNAALERDFKTWTIGAQYFMTPRTRVTLNYAMPKLSVPHANAIANPVQRNNAQAIARSMGNRLDLQVTAVF